MAELECPMCGYICNAKIWIPGHKHLKALKAVCAISEELVKIHRHHGFGPSGQLCECRICQMGILIDKLNESRNLGGEERGNG